MSELERRIFITAEMKPDVYGGESGDQVLPRWWAYTDGDMDGDHLDELKFSAKDYPPGTKITLSIPECPECQQDAQVCGEDEHCDFDWKHWTECQYS